MLTALIEFLGYGRFIQYLIFDKGARSIQWKKESTFNKWCWQNWLTTCRRMKVDPYLSRCTKLKSKWIKDLNISLKILNLKKRKWEVLDNILAQEITSYVYPQQQRH